jgi:hypothetical protein
LLEKIGASRRTSASAHRSPVNRTVSNGRLLISATVRPDRPAAASPSTTPNETPPA